MNKLETSDSPPHLAYLRKKQGMGKISKPLEYLVNKQDDLIIIDNDNADTSSKETISDNRCARL